MPPKLLPTLNGEQAREEFFTKRYATDITEKRTSPIHVWEWSPRGRRCSSARLGGRLSELAVSEVEIECTRAERRDDMPEGVPLKQGVRVAQRLAG